MMVLIVIVCFVCLFVYVLDIIFIFFYFIANCKLQICIYCTVWLCGAPRRALCTLALPALLALSHSSPALWHSSTRRFFFSHNLKKNFCVACFFVVRPVSMLTSNINTALTQKNLIGPFS